MYCSVWNIRGREKISPRGSCSFSIIVVIATEGVIPTRSPIETSSATTENILFPSNSTLSKTWMLTDWLGACWSSVTTFDRLSKSMPAVALPLMVLRRTLTSPPSCPSGDATVAVATPPSGTSGVKLRAMIAPVPDKDHTTRNGHTPLLHIYTRTQSVIFNLS